MNCKVTTFNQFIVSIKIFKVKHQRKKCVKMFLVPCFTLGSIKKKQTFTYTLFYGPLYEKKIDKRNMTVSLTQYLRM